jgi:tetratricopeptide (TPR) repeat protein
MSASITRDVARLEQLLEANPSDVGALKQIAKYYTSRHDYHKAALFYEQIMRVDGQTGTLWTALGHCYLLSGDYSKCLAAFQRAFLGRPVSDDPGLWYGLGLFYDIHDMTENAEKAYQAVIRLDPKFELDYEVQFRLGCILKKRDCFDQAITCLQNSLSSGSIPLSRKVEVLRHLAICYEKGGDKAKAIEMCSKVIEIFPGNFRGYELLGWIYARFNCIEEALVLLTRALELVGNKPMETADLHYLVGRVHLMRNKFSSSRKAFQKAIEINARSYIYWLSIGILYAEAQQPQDALSYFAKAMNLSDSAREVWYNMGLLYEQAGLKTEAVQAYTQACMRDFTYSLAVDRLRKITLELPRTIPKYSHAEFEVTGMPFSIKRTELPVKSLKLIPHPALLEGILSRATSDETVERTETEISSPTPDSSPKASAILEIPQAVHEIELLKSVVVEDPQVASLTTDYFRIKTASHPSTLLAQDARSLLTLTQGHNKRKGAELEARKTKRR